MRGEGDKIGKGEEEEEGRTKEDGEGGGRGNRGKRREVSSLNPVEVTCTKYTHCTPYP